MGVIFYLIFLAVTSLIAVSWFRRARSALATSREALSIGRQIVTIVGMVLLAGQLLVLAYLFLVVFDALIAEFDPGKPKPYFLVTYFLGLFLYGLLSFFRTPFDSDAGFPQTGRQSRNEEDGPS